MILELNLKSKILTIITIFCYSTVAFADPEANGELMPPGEGMYVTDPSILSKLNLGPDDEPVWCYSNLANSLIISSADREREKCQLKLNQELQRIKVDYTFEINQLNIQLDNLNKKHEELLSIKNKQIEDLTQAALKRPNDYSLWWATGGFASGVIVTVLMMVAMK